MILSPVDRLPPFGDSFARLAFVLVLVTTSSGCGGDSDPAGDASVAHTVDGRDGSVFETTCALAPVAAPALACGVVDGSPFYAFFDGCNWCACSSNGVFCTLAGCAETRAFKPSDCVRTYYGVSPSMLTEGETWVCDADGRVFRAACAPDVVTTSLP